MAVEITLLDPITLSAQTYDGQETSLIPTFEVDTSLSSESYIEFFIYSLNKNLIYRTYNFTQYSVLNNGQSAGSNNILSQIEIDLENVTSTALGSTQGKYILYFNFLNKKIGSDIQQLYITELSSDRTELRLDSTTLTNLDIVEQTNAFILEREESTYFLDFYINFGDNELFIANNISLDNTDPLNPTILIKLYDPLSEEYDINSTLWITTNVEEPLAYDINFINDPIEINDFINIQGPNFNIPIKDQINNSTGELSYSDLISTPVSSSFSQLNSFLEEKEIDINIDYTKFEEFVHFSSAQTRLENFFYKVNLIEGYSSSLATLNSSITGPTALTPSVSESKAVLENKINEVIKYFDGWEYYMYYSSGSYAWPKLNNEPPYQLASANSNIALTWFGSTNEYSPLYGGIILSASLYDNENKDNLLFSIPEYLRDDSENDQYGLFIDMVAQHFDNIWIYYKDVTQKYNADNRLEQGISKDIVADAIRDFGVKLYQNNFSNQDLYTAFLGLTPDGALFPFPNITGSLPTPSGFEYVDTLISASNDYLPLDDVNKSLYKRIYHNLPYLLKAKGTLPGLRALITSYGIPDTILRINEYGGKDKVNVNDWDYWQNEFNYAFKTDGNNFITSSWAINADWDDSRPSTVLFRFKTNGLPEVNTPYSQSLWNKGDRVHVVLTYTGSGYISGSYSGSIKDPYYQYATLTLYPAYNTNPTVSSSIYLPFFDGGWWSVMAKKNGNNYSISSGNKIYEGGENGTLLGFYASSSIIVTSNDWRFTSGGSTFASSSIINGAIYNSFSGSLQEIRYYQYAFGNSLYEEDEFKDYIMNPYSIEGNSLNSGPNELVFRASLGGELYTGSTSIHPKVTGSWIPTSSFTSDSDFYFNSTPIFVPNTEYFFYDQPIAGIKNTVSDKIRLENNTIPSGNTLSPFRRLEQITDASSSYTPNINYLEVAFSPQNEINEDIMDQLGFFNIGDYIGDPAERFSGTSYPNLDNLRNAYFEKYTKNYNLVDFIRLIKFFDNSLFKMIKDFVPARTSLASGVVIKQHLLERNKYPQPQVEWEDLDISGAIKSIQVWDPISQSSYISHSLIEEFSGGTAGSFEIFNGVNTSPYGIDGNGPNNIFGITQSWIETTPSLLGAVSTVHDSQEEFYDGEFSGSVILVTTQSLNQPFPQNYDPLHYKHVYYFSTGSGEQNIFVSNFLNTNTAPKTGEILFLCIIPGSKPNFSPATLNNIYTVTNIKISKQDCNNIDNTLPLGQLSQLLIQIPTSNLNEPETITYSINGINEYSDYYLYETSYNPWVIGEQIGDPSSPNKDQQLFDYTISASKSTPKIILSSTQVIDVWDISPAGTNLPHYGTPYFNTSSGYLTLENTPNTPIQISASITTNGTVGGLGKFDIIVNGESIAGTTYNTNGLGVVTAINAVYYGVQEDILNIKVTRPFIGAGTVTLVSASILTTQLRNETFLDIFYAAPLNSSCSLAILEPYISSPNFYNSDQNALLNNAVDIRQNSFIQDADYSTGVLTPTNFNALIEGNATKATIPDSNYTAKRIINPRYIGSESTSQFLNKWTPGDSGTYGKLPTIESTKTYVAYSDNVGGYAPGKMNTSGVLVKYLISEDGELISNNTSPNSLSIMKQNFMYGEKIELQTLGGGTTAQNPSLVIFKGGSSIEPILYNQIRHYENPPMTFSPTLSFSDRNPYSTSSVLDYTATLNPNNDYQVSSTGFSGIFMNEILAQGVNINTGAGGQLTTTTNRYTVTAPVINENVDLIFEVNMRCIRLATSLGTVYARVVRNRGGINTAVGNDFGGFISLGPEISINFTVNVPRAELQTGDQFFIAMLAGQPGTFYRSSSTFKISTNPYPTPSIDVTNLWRTGSSSEPNIIYTTSSQFIQYVNSSNIYQQDITGSGFFPITLPVTIQRGDEFRFEGDETKTFMVSDIEIYSASAYLPSDPALVVTLNNIISGSNININQFLLRRYVDNASALILDGLKPSGFQSPYLIKPEYVSNKMKENIGKYIEDFTSKGLL
jgi:hypothetical protein